jgi:hypothetical protein
MVGSLTRVALARSGAGNWAEGTLVPFLLYRGLWAASTPGHAGNWANSAAGLLNTHVFASQTHLI